jgi:hypothetical protein
MSKTERLTMTAPNAGKDERHKRKRSTPKGTLRLFMSGFYLAYTK